MATQALSYSPAPHHPSIASIHSQIKMSSGKIYLKKNQLPNLLVWQELVKQVIFDQKHQCYTHDASVKKTWSLQAFTAADRLNTSSVMFEEGLRLPKTHRLTNLPMFQVRQEKKTRTFR